MPDFLRGKKYLFMTCDESLDSSELNLSISKDGYVYLLSSVEFKGNEVLGKVESSKGRVLFVSKFFVYKELKSTSTSNTPTRNSIFVFAD